MDRLQTQRSFSFDLATIRGVVSKKWWVVPITMLVGVALMFWQESDLQTTPSLFVLTRTYEPAQATTPLVVMGLDPAMLHSYPNDVNQFIILRSKISLDKALDNIDSQLSLKVDRSEKRFNLSIDESVDSAGSTKRLTLSPYSDESITFTCTENTELNCGRAIDNYVAVFTEIRSTAIKAGLENAIKSIQDILANNTRIPETQLDQLRFSELALGQAINIQAEEIKLVVESRDFQGEQVTTVSKSTYLFGLLVGFILGCLILLQIIVSDNFIRSNKKLVDIVGYQNYLGNVNLRTQQNSIQHLAVSIRGSTAGKNTTHIRVVPIGIGSKDIPKIDELKTILNSEVTLLNPLSSLKAIELTAIEERPILLLVKRHYGKISELEAAWLLAEKSGNRVIGVALLE